jgi:alpha-amylase
LIEGPQGQPDTRENHVVLADAVAEVRRAYPQILFIGEVWADSPVIGPYVNQRNEMDLCFNFSFSGGLLGSLINERASDFENALLSNQQFVSSQRFLSPFITNHDMTRVSSLFQQNLDRLKLAAYLMLTSSGTPVLYYGEEIGMTNGPSISHYTGAAGGIYTAKPKMNPRNDMSKRTPMQCTTAMNHGFTGDGAKPWNLFSSSSSELTVEMQMKQSGSLLMAYRELIQIRKTKLPTALDRGQFIQSRDSSVSIQLRSAEGRLFQSIANFSRQSRPVQFSFSKSAANSARRAASGPINYQSLWGLTPFELHEQGNQIQVRIPSLAAFKALLIEIK